MPKEESVPKNDGKTISWKVFKRGNLGSPFPPPSDGKMDIVIEEGDEEEDDTIVDNMTKSD